MHRSLLALADHAFIASCNEEDHDALFADLRFQLHRVTASVPRHVFASGTTDEPAEISVQGCAGL